MVDELEFPSYKLSNGLTAASIERLALLSEECGEVIQVIGKILRHGFDSASPVPHEMGQETNRVLLAKEIADLNIIIWGLIEPSKDIEYETYIKKYKEKIERINKYLHYNQVSLHVSK